MDDFDIICDEILKELQKEGIETVIEAWGAPYLAAKTHCIACKYPLYMYIRDIDIKISWRYHNNWYSQNWKLMEPNSIESAIYWFVRRYQCIEILIQRGYQI